MDVKDILKQRRMMLHLTMREVADAVGVSEGTISRWESGDIENMRRDKIVALAKALQISPSVIMGWEELPEDKPVYYTNPETAQLSQDIHDNPELRILMDASRGLSVEDVKILIDMAKRMKGTNPDG